MTTIQPGKPNLSALNIETLRKFKRYYKLTCDETREKLVPAVSRHFNSLMLDDQKVLTRLVSEVKRRKTVAASGPSTAQAQAQQQPTAAAAAPVIPATTAAVSTAVAATSTAPITTAAPTPAPAPVATSAPAPATGHQSAAGQNLRDDSMNDLFQ